MDNLALELSALSSAEDFLHFFGVPYEERVVHVNRLHILKRFRQYTRAAHDLSGLDDIALFLRYREMLAQAYRDFVTSTAMQEKVFKVFRQVGGTCHVSLEGLRDSLAERARVPQAN